MEICRSRDGGITWSPPNVVSDSDADDRNPALGVTKQGSLILVYAQCTNYDSEGRWQREPHVEPTAFPWRIMASRSHDGGLTWERSYAVQTGLPRAISPYGKIVTLKDGTLLMALYIQGNVPTGSLDRAYSVYVLRSNDEGLTWGGATKLADGMYETGLLSLPNGDVLAAMRSNDDRSLSTSHSHDGGLTWTELRAVTGRDEHPADLISLRNGDLLLTYGNRNPPYRIEGLISRDGGHSWLDILLTFSGHLYGYTVGEARPYDLGYPSSAVQRSAGRGQGITAYYYTPSLRGGTSYEARSYYAIAVVWDEDELLKAVARTMQAGR